MSDSGKMTGQPNQTGKNPASAHILSAILGIPQAVVDRVADLERLSNRCMQIKDDLEQKTKESRSQAVKHAVEKTNKTLEEIAQGCANWLNTAVITRIGIDDIIKAKVSGWNKDLDACMDEFTRCLVLEVVDAVIDNPRLLLATLQQGDRLVDLVIDMKRQITSLQLQIFIEKAQRQSNSAILTQQEQDQVFAVLRKIVSERPVDPPSVELRDEIVLEGSPRRGNNASDIYVGVWNKRQVAVKRMRDLSTLPERIDRVAVRSVLLRRCLHSPQIHFKPRDFGTKGLYGRCLIIQMFCPSMALIRQPRMKLDSSPCGSRVEMP